MPFGHQNEGVDGITDTISELRVDDERRGGGGERMGPGKYVPPHMRGRPAAPEREKQNWADDVEEDQGRRGGGGGGGGGGWDDRGASGGNVGGRWDNRGDSRGPSDRFVSFSITRLFDI